MRDFLLYVSCSKGLCQVELFGNNRIYDVAINDYTLQNSNPEEAEYKFSVDEWKFRHIHKDLKDIVFKYKAIAIFDDDMLMSTDDLNSLFTIGETEKLNLWQASLTHDSANPWKHLYNIPNVYMLKTNSIELMMPIFSNEALKTCFDSFIINYSAWGLNIAWTHLLKEEKIMVIHSIKAKHTRPLTRGRIMPNGLTPEQDAELVFNHYGIKIPHPIY